MFDVMNLDVLPKKLFKCPQCSYSCELGRGPNLKRHIQTKHEKVKSSYKCPICELTYTRKNHFENHRRNCKPCNKIVKWGGGGLSLGHTTFLSQWNVVMIGEKTPTPS